MQWSGGQIGARFAIENLLVSRIYSISPPIVGAQFDLLIDVILPDTMVKTFISNTSSFASPFMHLASTLEAAATFLTE